MAASDKFDVLSCEDAVAKLEQFVDQELSATRDVAKLREHLDACAPCLQEKQLLDRTKEAVRSVCCEEAPSALRVRISAFIAAADEPRGDSTKGL